MRVRHRRGGQKQNSIRPTATTETLILVKARLSSRLIRMRHMGRFHRVLDKKILLTFSEIFRVRPTF